jgi:hypothetical protein
MDMSYGSLVVTSRRGFHDGWSQKANHKHNHNKKICWFVAPEYTKLSV